jgi:hypothetical protein
MDPRNDLNRAASLDQETISRTTSNRQLCSPPLQCSAMSHIHPEHDHDHLETVITLLWNR